MIKVFTGSEHAPNWCKYMLQDCVLIYKTITGNRSYETICIRHKTTIKCVLHSVQSTSQKPWFDFMLRIITVLSVIFVHNQNEKY